MSRPTEFRAWDNANKEWLNKSDAEDLIIRLDGSYEIDRGWAIIKPDLTIEQFTGLLDRNGKEIYEGDIVRVRTVSEESDIGALVAPIVWYKYKFCLGKPTAAAPNGWSLHYESKLIEVIGNVHENKETK